LVAGSNPARGAKSKLSQIKHVAKFANGLSPRKARFGNDLGNNMQIYADPAMGVAFRSTHMTP
jgi:hypothetical protein